MMVTVTRRCSWRHGKFCNPFHADLVESYRLAVEAQSIRADAFSIGYAPELSEFYATVEPRVTFKHWLMNYRQERTDDE